MSFAIAQIALDRKGMLPEDVIVNTMHFEDDSGFGTDAGLEINGPGLVDRLVTFYQAIGPATLGNSLNGTGRVTLYNHEDLKPRVPRIETAFTFTTGTTRLPGEVALCVSFQGAREAGANMARRRGRIFLGPLTPDLLLQVASGSDARAVVANVTAVLDAFRTMATGGSGAFRLAVYSPTTTLGGGSLADAYNDVTTIWADNTFDTIRKRGAAPTARWTGEIGSVDPFVQA